MSVDSYYYCSDLENATQYWHMSLADLIQALSNWNEPDKQKHMCLYTPEEVEQHWVPQIEKLVAQYSSERSLQQIWQSMHHDFTETYPDSPKNLTKLLKSRKQKKSVDNDLKQMIYVASFYNAFVQLSRRGPVSEVANTQFTDLFFPEMLERYMDKNKAMRYKLWNDAGKAILCVPNDIETNHSDTLEYIRGRLGAPTKLDTKWWLGLWTHLDEIPNLWNDLAKENNYENGIKQLKELARIAHYAEDHDLALIKEYC